MKITQHVPGFCDTGKPKTASVETSKQLFSVPFILSWSGMKGFKRFSVAENDGDDVVHLMAEFDDGKFWVVANLPKIALKLGLPKWVDPNPPKTIAEQYADVRISFDDEGNLI